MNKVSNKILKEPVERIMGKISKMSQTILQDQLCEMDIDRSFYPLMLIEAGNGITQQELATQLSCDKVQVVRIIDYLSENGYVQRLQSKVDKRKYELVVTDKAQKALPDIKKAFEEISLLTLHGLTENQKNELYTMLLKVEMNLLQNKTV